MKKTSIILCAAAICVCALLLVQLCVFAPHTADVYAKYRSIDQAGKSAILYSFYACALPAASALYCLMRITLNVYRDQAFLRRNSTYMGIISWCCLTVALICGVGGAWYMPLWFVSGAMLMLFLVVRVVRICFTAAAGIKEENSLTI